MWHARARRSPIAGGIHPNSDGRFHQFGATPILVGEAATVNSFGTKMLSSQSTSHTDEAAGTLWMKRSMAAAETGTSSFEFDD